MVDKNKTNLTVIGIVAVVAIVGIVLGLFAINKAYRIYPAQKEDLVGEGGFFSAKRSGKIEVRNVAKIQVNPVASLAPWVVKTSQSVILSDIQGPRYTKDMKVVFSSTDKPNGTGWFVSARGTINQDGSADGYTDIWEANLDGTNAVCKTCDWAVSSEPRHIGGAQVSSNSKWIIFQMEVKNYEPKMDMSNPGNPILKYDNNGKPVCQGVATPGVGIANELYVTDRNYAIVPSAPLRSHVLNRAALKCGDQWYLYGLDLSDSGNKLGWAESPSNGAYAVTTIADVSENGQYPPSLSNFETIYPGSISSNAKKWSEFGQWLSDDEFIGNGNIIYPSAVIFGDIFRYVISTKQTTYLTNTPGTSLNPGIGQWDETVHANEDKTLLAWHTSNTLLSPSQYMGCIITWTASCKDLLRTEYWLMGINGGNKRRMTYFNDYGYPESVNESAVGQNIAWQPCYSNYQCNDRGLVNVYLTQSKKSKVFTFILK